MSFSWDFLVAAVLVLSLVSLFLAVMPFSSSALAQSLESAEKQRNAIFKADFLLKNCFPTGTALCESGYLVSHAAHPDANLSFGSGGFCVKRLVLQNGVEKTLVACE